MADCEDVDTALVAYLRHSAMMGAMYGTPRGAPNVRATKALTYTPRTSQSLGPGKTNSPNIIINDQ